MSACRDPFDLLAKGVLSVEPGETYPHSQADAAHTELESRQALGPLLLIPGYRRHAWIEDDCGAGADRFTEARIVTLVLADAIAKPNGAPVGKVLWTIGACLRISGKVRNWHGADLSRTSALLG